MKPRPVAAVARGGGGTRRHLASWALVLGIAALVLLFVFSDTRELWHVASTLNVWLLAVPLACTAASYVAMARSYHGIAHAAGADVPFWEMFKITLVANTVNYVLSSGGISGFATRLYFFIRLSIPSNTAVLISLGQTVITNTVLLLFVVLGFGYLVTHGNLHGYALATTAGLLTVFVLLAVLVVVWLLHRGLRRRTLFGLAEAANWLLHRFLPQRKPARVRIWRFQRNLNRGIEFLLERKRSMAVPTLWIVVDWIATILILWGAFLTVHYPVPLSYVVVGFAVGIIFSFVSPIPGGLGVMEGSMAGIFVSLGVPFEIAVVAALIFRVFYYVLPMIISVFFFRGMLVQGAHATEEEGMVPI